MKRDLRAYARQSNVRILLGAFGLLFGVGVLLIGIFYGPGAAVMGLLCLLAGLVPIVLIMATLYGIDWVVKRERTK